MRRVCVTIKKYNVNKPPSIRIDSSLQSKMKTWSKLHMSTILWMNSKNCHKYWETLCLLIILSLSNALWCFICFLIEIQLIQNYFFSLKCTFRTIISDEKSDKTYNLTEIDIKHWHFISYFFFYCLKNYKKFDLIKVFLKKIM